MLFRSTSPSSPKTDFVWKTCCVFGLEILSAPLRDPPSRLAVSDDIRKGTGADDCDVVLLEVVPQSPQCHEHSVHQFLVLGIPLLGLGKDIADVVHRSLCRMFLSFLRPLDSDNDADDSRGRGDVQEQRLLVFW